MREQLKVKGICGCGATIVANALGLTVPNSGLVIIDGTTIGNIENHNCPNVPAPIPVFMVIHQRSGLAVSSTHDPESAMRIATNMLTHVNAHLPAQQLIHDMAQAIQAGHIHVEWAHNPPPAPTPTDLPTH